VNSTATKRQSGRNFWVRKSCIPFVQPWTAKISASQTICTVSMLRRVSYRLKHAITCLSAEACLNHYDVH
jgi:hypothetical protein